MRQNDPVADDDVKRFAALLRKKEADEQAVRDAAQADADDRRTKAEHARSVEAARATKDRAAARLRDVRRGRATPEQIATADGDYRAALAALLELEQGVRPAWAPVLQIEPDAPVGDAGGGVDEAVVGDDHAEAVAVEP